MYCDMLMLYDIVEQCTAGPVLQLMNGDKT